MMSSIVVSARRVAHMNVNGGAMGDIFHLLPSLERVPNAPQISSAADTLMHQKISHMTPGSMRHKYSWLFSLRPSHGPVKMRSPSLDIHWGVLLRPTLPPGSAIWYLPWS